MRKKQQTTTVRFVQKKKKKNRRRKSHQSAPMYSLLIDNECTYPTKNRVAPSVIYTKKGENCLGKSLEWRGTDAEKEKHLRSIPLIIMSCNRCANNTNRVLPITKKEYKPTHIYA